MIRTFTIHGDRVGGRSAGAVGTVNLGYKPTIEESKQFLESAYGPVHYVRLICEKMPDGRFKAEHYNRHGNRIQPTED